MSSLDIEDDKQQDELSLIMKRWYKDRPVEAILDKEKLSLDIDIYGFFEDHFSWDLKFFTKLNDLVIKLDYTINSYTKLKEIKECLQYKIKNSLIWDFNDFLEYELKSDRIQNHWDSIRYIYNKNPEKIFTRLCMNETNESVSLIINKLNKNYYKNPKNDNIVDKLTNNNNYKIINKNLEIISENINTYQEYISNFSNKNNDNMVKFLFENINMIYWAYFSLNPNDKAVDFILKPENQNKIIWNNFSMNINDKAIEFMLKPENQNKITWTTFSTNKNDKAVEFMLKSENQDRIVWETFSANPNDKAVEFMLKPENQDKIDWNYFIRNPNDKAVDFMLKPENQDKILFDDILHYQTNPKIFHIFENHFYDYEPIDILKSPNSEIQKYFLKIYGTLDPELKNTIDHLNSFLQSRYNYFDEKIEAFNKAYRKTFKIYIDV